MGMEGKSQTSQKNGPNPFNITGLGLKQWLRGLDLNQRPSGYEPDDPAPGDNHITHYGSTNYDAFWLLNWLGL
jgi:hypothetical protein